MKKQPLWVKWFHLVPNGHSSGNNKYPPFWHSAQNQVSIYSCIGFFISCKNKLWNNLIYDVVSVATCPKMKQGVKTAQRWCRGSKNIRNEKNLFRIKNLFFKNSNFILITFFYKSIHLWFGNLGSIIDTIWQEKLKHNFRIDQSILCYLLWLKAPT